jgi:fused signal recognition particle receptor
MTATDFADDLPQKPYVIMVVGVNGVGKTTTIGKIAWQFKKAGKRVLLGAADTFRAAAIDQLGILAERVDVPLIRQKMGSISRGISIPSSAKIIPIGNNCYSQKITTR